MASLEEMMAGLFGGNLAPGAQDDRRRRGPGSGGYEGIGGAGVTPGMLLPYFTNQPVYDYSGPMAARMGGRGGLMDLLAQSGTGRDASGPAMRHFQNQGFDFMPPGQVDNPAIGGPNVAPGNLDNGQALDQPQANPTPGVPRGVARGQSPGQVTPTPRTQGWRNLAGGYSAAAQFGYGTPEFGRLFAPGASLPPGATGGGAPGERVGPIGGYGGGPRDGGTEPGRGPLGGVGGGPSPGGMQLGPGPRLPGGGGGGGGSYIDGPTGPRRPDARQLAAAKGGSAGGSRDAGGKPGGPSQRQVSAKKGGATQPSSPTNSLNVNPQRDAGGRKGGPTNTQVAAAKSGTQTKKPQSKPHVPNSGNNNTPSETKPYVAPPSTSGSTRPKPRPRPTQRQVTSRKGGGQLR